MSGNDEVARLFAENLKRHRKAAAISQNELAVMASCDRTEISMLERAIRVPRISTLIKLSSSLEVSPEDLLEGIDWRPGTLAYGKFRIDDQEPS
jgi:transcriptional regulator with XRE-family HTH domain